MSTEKPGVITPTAVLPPGCDLNGCRHHYPPGRNLAAEGCICPAWFDGGGWHIIGWNRECAAHHSESGARGPAASHMIVDELRLRETGESGDG